MLISFLPTKKNKNDPTKLSTKDSKIIDSKKVVLEIAIDLQEVKFLFR